MKNLKLNIDENAEPTGGEKFLLDYTASSTWDQIKYMNWTTSEVIDVMNQYFEKGNPDAKDLTKLDSEDLMNILEDHKRSFVKVNFFARFEKGMVTDLDYQIIEYGLLDEDQIKLDIEQTEDWTEYVEGDFKDGYYVVDAMFRVETDGDDFRDWSWGELDHAEITWAHTIEEVEQQMKEAEETNDEFDDLFSL